MSDPVAPSSLLAARKKKPPPKMMTKVQTIVHKRLPVYPTPAKSQSRAQPIKPSKNGAIRKDAAMARRPSTPASSRPSSKEPVERIKQERSRPNKRASPTVTTPQFTSSDEDEEDMPRKRVKTEEVVDPGRQIRDPEAFRDTALTDTKRVHAYDIANSTLVEHSRTPYATYFTALTSDEEEDPTIELEYPGAATELERYQLVTPSDRSDFKPIAEILETMELVAEYYLDESTAKRVYCDDDGSGLYQKLKRASVVGGQGVKAGVQTTFIDIVKAYNKLISEKRKDGTITRTIDAMPKIPLKLVDHIIKKQIYARTVSPKVHLVRQYEGFSDNVYGELLPLFLSRIFKETRLRSGQIFVDLGSGVGNCVLQAALETGCEAWGCEMMDNPAKLAESQSAEFPARCKLWGLKPGPIHLIHDDFLQNAEIGEVLKRADVILINNQAFTAELNDKLKLKFFDLKEGAQIVSLKYYRDPLHRIKDSNFNDPINMLTVKERDRFSGMVSWSDDPGKWYIQSKDTTELQALERKKLRDANGSGT
jgi:[histone H3]-lysine79 N-trimethyltransferase